MTGEVVSGDLVEIHYSRVISAGNARTLGLISVAPWGKRAHCRIELTGYAKTGRAPIPRAIIPKGRHPAPIASFVAVRVARSRLTCVPLFALGLGRALAATPLASGASEFMRQAGKRAKPRSSRKPAEAERSGARGELGGGPGGDGTPCAGILRAYLRVGILRRMGKGALRRAHQRVANRIASRIASRGGANRFGDGHGAGRLCPSYRDHLPL
uniref:Uncharacterized protein n=1 Tax=Candidatus Kentrum sp. TUN TaxID=2126343 RepID=A0A450ZA28_9GAMM|nr:MAG: hypothetical protein BECKTUN1418D_GA0071000_10011 [Candidatus Kentron sp. TUN]